jgi:hypothetical protein
MEQTKAAFGAWLSEQVLPSSTLVRPACWRLTSPRASRWRPWTSAGTPSSGQTTRKVRLVLTNHPYVGRCGTLQVNQIIELPQALAHGLPRRLGAHEARPFPNRDAGLRAVNATARALLVMVS